jgi:protein O-mannosyl-transferase
MWRSALVAGLFALHPLHVESVAWVAERKDVLSTFFFLLTLLAYARYVEKTRPASRTIGGSKAGLPTDVARFTFHVSRHYMLALGLFALGLMSKPMLVTLPFLLLLLDFWPLHRLPSSNPLAHPRATGFAALLLEKIPFLGLAMVSSIITFLVQKKAEAIGLPFSLRLGNAVASYVRYLGKTFWPADLSILYPHPGIYYYSPGTDLQHVPAQAWSAWQTIAAAALLAAVSLVALRRWKRQPWFGLGWFWYLGTLVPVIGIVQVGVQAMADRYTYIPLIGVFVCVVWGAAELLERLRGGGAATPQGVMGADPSAGSAQVPRSPRCGLWWPAAFATAGVAALTACGLATHRQVQYWHNNRTVFEHALAVNPNNPIAHCHIGQDFGNQGDHTAAMAHFRAALDADPHCTEALYYLGLSYELQGKPEAAIEQLESAVRLNPGHELAHLHLGMLLQKRGKTQEACTQFGLAAGINPENAEARRRLGLGLLELGETAEAQTQLAEAVRLEPDNGEARDALTKLVLKDGNLAEAEAQFRRLVKLRPADAEFRMNLGGVLWRRGKQNEAMAQYAEAARLNPRHPAAHYNLGFGLAALGRPIEAINEFTQALQLKPDYIDALTELGRVLAGMGRFEEATARFQEAARLCPTNANFHLNLANALMMAGQTNAAAASFAAALRVEPGLAEKLVQAGKSLANQGQPDAALARFRTALALKPDWAEALNDLAWVLATHPEARVRNGPEAVRLAERACETSGGKEARFWATLDAAYAETGRFAEAISTAEKARDLAQAAHQDQVVRAAEARLALYRKQQPFHHQ